MKGLQTQVGKRIRHLREEKGLSQEALAAASNLHRTYVGLIERGERNLSLATIEVIAQALEVPASELFSGLDKSEGRKPALKSKGHLKPGEAMAHIATIRQILMDAKIVDAQGYDLILGKKTRES